MMCQSAQLPEPIKATMAQQQLELQAFNLTLLIEASALQQQAIGQLQAQAQPSASATNLGGK